MKDMVGNDLKLGDRVATDVLSTKVSHLRVGVINAVEKDHIKIYYKLQSRSYDYKARKYVEKTIARSLWRHPEYVVKVAGGI